MFKVVSEKVKQKDANEKNISNISLIENSFIVWLISWTIFILIILVFGDLTSKDLESYSIPILIDIAIGTISFLVLWIVGPFEKGSNKETARRYMYSSILLIMIPFAAMMLTASKNIPKANPVVEQYEELPLITPEPTVATISKKAAGQTTNKIDCIGPDGKQFNTTMEECKNLNEKWGKSVDYITSCNIAPECGGGTIKMSKSQCDKPCSGLSVGSNNVGNNTNSAQSYDYNKYPLCTVYYSYLNKSETYKYFTPEYCESVKKTAQSSRTIVPAATTVPIYTAAPTQTQAAATNNDACLQARSSWIQFKENFNADGTMQFSSSYEEIVALNKEMQKFQSLLDQYGCRITLTL